MDNKEKDFYTNDTFGDDKDTDPLQPQIEELSKRCMVLGIVAVSIAGVCPYLFIASVVLGILSLRSLSKAKKLMGASKMNGWMTAGMVCSIVALSLSAFYLLIGLLFVFMISLIILAGVAGGGGGVAL